MVINQYPPEDNSLTEKSAFGEFRVVEPTPKVQVQFPYNVNARQVQDLSGGGGGITHASGMAIMSTSASANASGVLQTRDVLKYNTGQGGLVRFTAIFTSGVADSKQVVGLGDDIDGFFFGYNGADFGVLKRRDGVDEWTTQANWNINTLPDLDPQLGNVYQVAYQWLGFGQITFFVEDKDVGMFVPVHRIQYANTHLEPSVLNPTLPIMAFAANVTNTTNIVVKTPSLAAFSEGSELDKGLVLASGISASITATEVPIFSIKNLDTFQSKTNRVRVKLNSIIVDNDGNQGAKFRLLLNPTLTGATFTAIDANQSVVATDVGASAFAGGTAVDIIDAPAAGSASQDISNLQIVLNPGDIATIVGRRLVAGSSTVETSLVWEELF